MNTVIIQLTQPNTMRLLQELENLHLLRVLKKNVSSKVKLSDKYSGKLSEKVGLDLQKYIKESRSEWNSSI